MTSVPMPADPRAQGALVRLLDDWWAECAPAEKMAAYLATHDLMPNQLALDTSGP